MTPCSPAPVAASEPIMLPIFAPRAAHVGAGLGVFAAGANIVLIGGPAGRILGGPLRSEHD
jgi:hypothetical protein